MKLNTTLLLPRLLIALGAALWITDIHAQTVDIKITGSTAFRSLIYTAIRGLYDGGVPASQNPADVSGSSGTSSSNLVTFSGTMTPLFGSRTVIVRTSWSGSATGIRALTSAANVTFLANTTAGDYTTTIQAPADFALSDVFQSSTVYATPVLEDSAVGVVVFAFVRSVSAPTTVANVTHQQAQVLLANGVMPLSYFTGNSADANSLVHLVGRDSGSGTRITTHADTGFGIFTTPQLYKLDASNNWIQDNVGFSSGGGVKGVLNTAAPQVIALSYLGLGDAAGVNAGANSLTYNGNPPTLANVRSGLYSFWGYEHLFNRSGLDTDHAVFRDGTDHLGTSTSCLKGAISAQVALNPNYATVASMGTIHRNADGGAITP